MHDQGQLFSSRELAEIAGTKKRAIETRAKRGKWTFLTKTGIGGTRRLYPLSGLPEDICQKITAHTEQQAVNNFLATVTALDSSPPAPVHHSPAQLTGITAARKLKEAEIQALTDKQTRMETCLALFRALSESNRRAAERKHFLLTAFDAFAKEGRYLGRTKQGRERMSNRGLALFCTAIENGVLELPADVAEFITRKGKRSLTPKTLREWRDAYAAFGLYGLADHYVRKAGTTSLTTAMIDFLLGMLYDHPHSTAVQFHDGLMTRFKGVSLPSKHAVNRYIATWKETHPSLFLFITDPDGWRNRRMFAYGRADEKVTALNMRWEADATKADILCTDGRCCLIGIIDVWSRRFKLLAVPTSKAVAIGALLRRCLMDWGVPSEFRTDCGSDFTAFYIERVCDALEIDHHLCTEFCPEQKPFIERTFKTFSHGLLELLDGYVGHDVAARKKIEARRSFAKRLMTSGETIEARLTMAELQKWCDDWCDNIYHQNKHGGLGMSPAAKARSWLEPVARIKDERALDILLYPAPSNDGFRMIGKKGIEVTFAGVKLNYAAGEFCGHEGEYVRVLMDLSNLGRAVLFDAAGEFFAVAEDPRYFGISGAETANYLKNKQKKVHAELRQELKSNAKQQGTKNIAVEIMAERASEAAKIAELPKPAVEYSTPALQEAAKATAELARKDAKPCGIPLTPAQEAFVAQRQAQPKSPLPGQPKNKLEQYFAARARRNNGTATAEDVAFCEEFEAQKQQQPDRVNKYEVRRAA